MEQNNVQEAQEAQTVRHENTITDEVRNYLRNVNFFVLLGLLLNTATGLLFVFAKIYEQYPEDNLKIASIFTAFLIGVAVCVLFISLLPSSSFVVKLIFYILANIFVVFLFGVGLYYYVRDDEPDVYHFLWAIYADLFLVYLVFTLIIMFVNKKSTMVILGAILAAILSTLAGIWIQVSMKNWFHMATFVSITLLCALFLFAGIKTVINLREGESKDMIFHAYLIRLVARF
ncbi:MAG: uncharacterized protein A8A55_1623 [Amphiamblys sp. WSBS2006]|nr:MAG: uncharacterized protein A8A55_1623 [Amphiamblys sp. WSBS2006]